MSQRNDQGPDQRHDHRHDKHHDKHEAKKGGNLDAKVGVPQGKSPPEQLPNQLFDGWLHELAKAELHPEAENLLQLGRCYDPQQLIEESALEFLFEMRDYLNDYCKLFNGYADGNTNFQEIKVYSIAQTPADFMLFRNQIKLIFSNPVHGLLQISFSHHARGNVAVNGTVTGGTSGSPQSAAPSGAQELIAQLGPFRNVYWTFQGEKVTADQVAKFYFVEFARTSRDPKRSRAGNQLLLDQIKALLQEKGLNL